MSNITKKAMAQSLKKMLLVKDLDKITITDITNDCGINRQTFYYHFKDIYDLLEWIFANEVVEKIEKETTIETWQENFKYVLDYMLKNKKFIVKTYNSLSRKTLLDFLFKQYNTIFIEIVNDLSKNYDITKENKMIAAVKFGEDIQIFSCPLSNYREIGEFANEFNFHCYGLICWYEDNLYDVIER